MTTCDDGSLCCNDDPTCCAAHSGVFLDQDGNIASTLVTAAVTSYPPVDGTGTDRFTVTPSTSTSSSTTTATTAALDTIPTSSEASVTTSSAVVPSNSSAVSSQAESGSGSDASLKIGLGLGITLTAVVVGCLAFVIPWWWRRRKRRAQPTSTGEGSSGVVLKTWEPVTQDRPYELYNDRQQQFGRAELA